MECKGLTYVLKCVATGFLNGLDEAMFSGPNQISNVRLVVPGLRFPGPTGATGDVSLIS